MKHWILLLVVLGACAPRTIERPLHFGSLPTAPFPEHVDESAAADPMAKPPPRGIAPPSSFPTVARRELANGLGLRVLERHNLPVVSLMLVIQSGQATDRDKPGLAVVAGELMKQGGAGAWTGSQLLEKVEALGADLEVATDRDATTISISVTSDRLATALDVLAAVATRPRFDRGELEKLRSREIERVDSSAHESPEWAARMVLYRDLYTLPAGIHPYARFDATAPDLHKLTLDDCKRWYRENVTPRNAFLVVAGDVGVDLAASEAGRAFNGWKGDAPAPPSFTAPMPPARLEVRVVDRPGSVQSNVLVAVAGPERSSDRWAALAVANQILGGGVAGRLFTDVREKRSLAYSTGSRVEELAHGPVPIVLSAGTRTEKTGRAVEALLTQLDKLGASAPTDNEVTTASDFLADSFALRQETIDAVAGLSAHLGVMGLADDYYDQYRAAVRDVDVATIEGVAREWFQRDHALVVVSGDAAHIAAPLSHFGPVQVIDPEHGFTVVRSVPADPTASIDGG